MESINRTSDIERLLPELTGHGVGDGQVGIAQVSSKDGFIPPIDWDKELHPFVLSKDSVTIVVPVNDQLAPANERYNESYMERRDGWWILANVSSQVQILRAYSKLT